MGPSAPEANRWNADPIRSVTNQYAGILFGLFKGYAKTRTTCARNDDSLGWVMSVCGWRRCFNQDFFINFSQSHPHSNSGMSAHCWVSGRIGFGVTGNLTRRRWKADGPEAQRYRNWAKGNGGRISDGGSLDLPAKNPLRNEAQQ